MNKLISSSKINDQTWFTNIGLYQQMNEYTLYVSMIKTSHLKFLGKLHVTILNYIPIYIYHLELSE